MMTMRYDYEAFYTQMMSFAVRLLLYNTFHAERWTAREMLNPIEHV